jgi:hypothetical protein
MGKENKEKVKKNRKDEVPRHSRTKRAIKLAMDCTWNEEGRCLKNKDEPLFGVGRIRHRISEL